MNCEWAAWSECKAIGDPSATCGQGEKTRSRAISANDIGKPCDGPATAACDLGPCRKLDWH